MALGMWVFLTVIARFPQTFNYPCEATPEMRARFAPITQELIGWTKLEIIWTFVLTAWTTIRAAENAYLGYTFWLIFVSFIVILGTVWVYAARMRRMMP